MSIYDSWTPNQWWTQQHQDAWQQDPRATATYAPGSYEAQLQAQDLANWQSSGVNPQGGMGPQLLTHLQQLAQAQGNRGRLQHMPVQGRFRNPGMPQQPQQLPLQTPGVAPQQGQVAPGTPSPQAPLQAPINNPQMVSSALRGAAPRLGPVAPFSRDPFKR